MKFPQLVGASYQSQSTQADVQRTVNLYPEILESGDGKNRWALYGTPGYAQFLSVSANAIRSMFAQNNHIFVASGTSLYDVISTGLNATYTAITNDSLPVHMAANSTQLFLNSGGNTYKIQSGALTAVTTPITATNCVAIGFLDGYFIALEYDANSGGGRRFYISALNDCATWDALDIATVYGSANGIVQMLVDHGEIWFFGNQMTQVYTNTGAADFPFEPRKDATIEQGCAAKWSVQALDNSIFWLGSDRRGGGVVWRAEGYTPKRVSDHAMETAMRGYASITDAEAWSYSEAGHQFYMLYFPTAGKTWSYDVSTGRWHERMFLNGSSEEAHKGRCHAFAFGKNIIGDRSTGLLHELKLGTYTDNGSSIRRERIAPHITEEAKRVFYSRLRLDVESGATWDLASSNDGGGTYGTTRSKADTTGRPEWNALGSAFDRVFRLRTTSATKIAIVNAYLELGVGN